MSSGLQQKACHAETGTLNFFDLFNFFLLYANGESQFNRHLRENIFFTSSRHLKQIQDFSHQRFPRVFGFFWGAFCFSKLHLRQGTLNHGLSKMQDVILVEFSKLRILLVNEFHMPPFAWAYVTRNINYCCYYYNYYYNSNHNHNHNYNYHHHYYC